MTILGNSGQFVIGTKVFDESRNFYTKLRYKITNEGQLSADARFLEFTDGRMNFLLHENEINYQKLSYFSKNLDEQIEKLQELKYELNYKTALKKSLTFHTEDDLMINIVEDPKSLSPNPMLSASELELGKLGEIAVTVENLDNAISEYTKLGYETKFRDDNWQFAILSDDIFVMGLHAHEMNDIIAVTYFHPDLSKKLAFFEENGINIDTQKEYEVKDKTNIDLTITSPEGTAFYFFTGLI